MYSGAYEEDEEETWEEKDGPEQEHEQDKGRLLYTSPSPRDRTRPRLPASA